MGHQIGFQPKLLYPPINLDQEVGQNHILRKIREQIDFDFISDKVEDCFGDNLILLSGRKEHTQSFSLSVGSMM